MSVRSGLEVLLEEGAKTLTGKRVGLIANHTAVDRHLRSAVDLLHDSGVVELAALFGPEHGVRGDAQAGVAIETTTDARTGLPVHSLYGATRQPTPGMLDSLDALVFDIQDVGVRYATYVSTMVLAQEAAAAAGLKFVVLDRPNPLTGDRIDGNVLDSAFVSFVGTHSIPILHGLTAGELARMVASDRGWPEPDVVPMRGWRRRQWFDETELIWIQPSPNLPTLDALIVYPGTCLIEGTNLSEGRGTTRPFEYIGAPWLDPFRFAEEMTARDLAGCAFRPAYFTPMFSKHAGQVCGGVQMHVTDRSAMTPVALGIHLLEVVRSIAPGAFSWRTAEDGQFFVDLLFGSDRLRRMLDDGAGATEVMAGWDDEHATFAARRQPFLIYS